ncbi:MAG: GNAT family N-acetyltransferase [Candidatus Eisenbacteria bacterium]|nr:GNAT family N-acetyltransferase [Candidatus Latescibacterota bacterium]MBD3301385.1 GNAT family N-acetyltransferase [Candidatus Eisenbacteria bacterium]
MPDRPIQTRRCREQDLLPVARLITRTFNELRTRTGKDPISDWPRRPNPLFQHMLRTDPTRFRCAWRGKRMVGFAGALLRGKQWYLAFLFVDPRYQDRGVGRRLLQEVWHEGSGVSHSLSTMAYNMQAVGLYSRFGMLPRIFFTMMQARPERFVRPGATGLTAAGELGPADRRWIDRLESRVRGFFRRPEWDFWIREAKVHPFLFRRGRRRIGYGVVSEGGMIGPVGVEEEADLPDVLAETLRCASDPDRERPSGWRATLFCPHPQAEIYASLLESGFRNREMLLLMSDAPYGDFRRYVPASLALL